ncbi:MAG: hypothetical protein ACLGJB_08960 [Blastocatellia bacterium]
MNITQSSRFIEASNLSSTAWLIACGPPRLYPLIISANFINSSQIHAQLVRFLRIAEIAYGQRNVEILEQAGQHLIRLPLQQASDAGMYFLAMAARRQGRREEARAMLQQVAASGTPRFVARAIQALGTIEHEENRLDEALHLYVKAASIASEADSAAFINAQFQFSSIKSLAGDHQHSLDDLEKLWSYVRVVARDYQHIFFAYHNELAYELVQVGKFAVAQQVIQVAINSPLVDKYPEWQETAADIQQQVSRPFIIAVPAIEKEKPAQESKSVRLSCIFADQPGRRAFNQRPTIRDNQITFHIASEWVKLCTPIRAPTTIS